ncbi:MAG: hypothetical protein ABIP93_10505 [Gemmatimonadaceae bacterium]
MGNPDDRHVDLFERVTALAAETAELRERESVELNTLALALADFAREHTLGEKPPTAALSLRARMQARFQLGGMPSHIGDGLYLSADGRLLAAELREPGATRRNVLVTVVAMLIAGLVLNGGAAVLTVIAIAVGMLASTLWKGVGGTAHGFRALSPDEEHTALVVLRRTLDRLERDVHDDRGRLRN